MSTDMMYASLRVKLFDINNRMYDENYPYSRFNEYAEEVVDVIFTIPDRDRWKFSEIFVNFTNISEFSFQHLRKVLREDELSEVWYCGRLLRKYNDKYDVLCGLNDYSSDIDRRYYILKLLLICVAKISCNFD